MAACPHYRWLGGLPHAATRRRIQAAHVLVHASRMEGGAHVVIEALRSGTPVLASCIDGNLGVLGVDYAGTFAPGDTAALVTLLQRARDDPAMLPALRAQCEARAPLFEPARESAALHALLAELLPTTPLTGTRR
jgi:glycosyltransferase involved in cell wall biosynthesis